MVRVLFQGMNSLTQCLIRSINESGKLHMVPAVVGDTYLIRFAVCAEKANEEDIAIAWRTIQRFADEIIAANNSFLQWRSRVKKFQKVPESPKEEDEEEEEEEVDLDLDEFKEFEAELAVSTPSFDVNGVSCVVMHDTFFIFIYF